MAQQDDEQDDEIMREFLIESRDNLAELDRDFVELERNPRDKALLSRIFRVIHTIKGTSGFLNLPALERLTHIGETQLSRLRDGEILLDSQATSALLAMVDAVRRVLSSIERERKEGDEDFSALIAELQRIGQSQSVAAPPKPSARPAPQSLTAPAKSSTPEAPPARASSLPSPVAISAAPSRSPAKATAEPARAGSVADSSVRVDVGQLDHVMNLVGELVLARNQILQYGAASQDPGFAGAAQRLNVLTTELQASVMKTRMQPIGNVWNRFPRVVRDLANVCQKAVELELDGSSTELDRSIIEAIKDPLIHAVRNAIDHGIESAERRRRAGKPATGRLRLSAYHEGGQVNIEVSDDGGGIDADKVRARALQRGLVSDERALRMSERELLQLIFLPGFSTAEAVTHLSGRGVGMDVVKTNIEKIGGTVDVSSRPGAGTTLKIKIPLTLAIIPALVVTSGGEHFAIPQVNLVELVRLEGDARGIEILHGTPLYRLRGNLLPLVFLNDALKLPRRSDAGVSSIVVLQADDRQFGLVVDGINDTEEIVVKPLGKELKSLDVFAGATIMGDGRVTLILDALGVARRAGVLAWSRDRGTAGALQAPPARAELRESLLLFRVGGSARMAIPLSLVARLEEIAPSAIERAGGREVIQYRGAVLPLVFVEREFSAGARVRTDQPLLVVVYTERGKSVGLVVEEILDFVDEVVRIDDQGRGGGLLGVAVIQGRVTDLLDVHGLIRRQLPNFFGNSEAAA
jgi:two-component system, chemotaxis family, sensor kinase CheA